MNPTVRHIVTGDLSIMKNMDLRNLVTKGLNYRESHNFSNTYLANSMQKNIEEFIKQSSISFSQNIAAYDVWKKKVLELINLKIKSKITKRFKTPALDKKIVQDYLKDLHKHFVLTHTDKATNNLSIICKKFYVETLKNELENTPTYESTHLTVDGIIKDHADIFNKDHRMSDKDNKLPHIYWLPKQHKTPVSSRFVVSGRNCTVKSLSKNVTKALRIIQKAISFQCNYDHKFKKTSGNWIINSSHKVHENIQHITMNSKAKSIYTADFSTLYNLIPHSQLLDKIRKMVIKGFQISKNFIRLNKSTATWRDTIPSLPDANVCQLIMSSIVWNFY